MTIKRIILGGAGAVALLFGSLLGPAASATAQPAPGSGALPDQTCVSLTQQLSSARAELRLWVHQRDVDERNGLDTSFDDSEIALLEDAIHQDGVLLHDFGCQ